MALKHIEIAIEGTEPDEDDVRDYIQDYSDARRLTTDRANQLLEKAMAACSPDAPEPDECCGSNCDPCVKHIWREEVAVWKAVRVGEPCAEKLAKQSFKK